MNVMASLLQTAVGARGREEGPFGCFNAEFTSHPSKIVQTNNTNLYAIKITTYDFGWYCCWNPMCTHSCVLGCTAILWHWAFHAHQFVYVASDVEINSK